jgi:hypothetical protein
VIAVRCTAGGGERRAVRANSDHGRLDAAEAKLNLRPWYDRMCGMLATLAAPVSTVEA